MTADLSHTDLRHVNLSNIDLRAVNLYNVDLRHADLSRADLRGVDLCKADLRYTNISHADFRGADLRKADLRGASLYGTDFHCANLYGVHLDFSHVFIGAVNILTISASRDRITAVRSGLVYIGCIGLPLDSWFKRCQEIGERHKYSPEAIAEYRGHLETVRQWLNEEDGK